MDDGDTLAFIREQAANARYTFSVCTGALILGAAGLLKGRKATTQWAALHLLKYFGAVPVVERVVIDENVISTAGVTAGIDGALRLAALLRGEQKAQEIQSSRSAGDYRTRSTFSERPLGKVVLLNTRSFLVQE